MNQEDILKNYEYHVWANERLFDHLASLPPDLQPEGSKRVPDN